MIYTIMKTRAVEVVGEISSLLKLYSDGSVVRTPNPTTPASSQFTDGVASKDVVINPGTGVWARIFKPETASQKPPLVIYFHGGGFAVCSTASVEFHAFLHKLCKTASVVILSVDYRLAPENRLPAAYDDCTEAVEWASKHAVGKAEVAEEWLSPSAVDFSRCFLAGESAGGNIVHHVGLRVADMDLKPLKVKGLIALHPGFGSEEMVDSEKGEEMEKSVELCNFIWSISLPAGSDRNHPYCNVAVSPIKDGLQLPPVLVGVAGKDEIRERGMMYYEYLKKCGKEAELLWEESGVHCYHITHPEFEGTWRLLQRFSNFVDTH